MFNDVNNNDILYIGENIIEEVRPERFPYILGGLTILPFIIIWVLFDSIFIFVFAHFWSEMDTFVKVFLFGFFAIHLTPVWIFLGGFFKRFVGYNNVSYLITDRRVIFRGGIVGTDFSDIQYSEITGVTVNVGFIDKLFGVGDIYIQTSGVNDAQTNVIISDVKNPYRIYKIINQTYMDIKSDLHFPNAYRPDENPGYNTRYRR